MKRYRIVNEWPSNRLTLQRFNGEMEGRYGAIYGLCEPADRERKDGWVMDGTVRYIGQSWEPDRRFMRHLTQTVRSGTACGRWIRSLKRLNQIPAHVILEQRYYRDQAELDAAEQKWIAAFRCGPEKDWLLNHTAGGHSRGLFTGKAGQESKRKMSDAAKSEKRRALLAKMQSDPEIQARRRARVAEAQQRPEWREKMREILARSNRDPETIEKLRQNGRSEANLLRLRRIGLAHGKWQLEDTLHILREHHFGSRQRAQMLALIRDGMTVGEFVEACVPLGTDTRHILGKFINVYHIVEVRKPHTGTC
jgi:hypothetical protein